MRSAFPQASLRTWLTLACLTIAGPAAFALDEPTNREIVAAIRNNDSEVLVRALKFKPGLGLKAQDGKTILMAAAADNNYDLVNRIINRGIDVRVTNYRGGTALMYAAANGAPDVAGRLIDAGSNVNERASNGWTALTLAAAKGHEEVVELLLARGANPNVPDVFGWTPLMRATQNGYLAVVIALLAHQATDVAWVNVKGDDAWRIAVAAGHCAIAGQLKRPADGAGNDPDGKAQQKRMGTEQCLD